MKIKDKHDLKIYISNIVESLFEEHDRRGFRKYHQLNENLNKCINEEFGISLDVEVCYKKAVYQIKNDLRNGYWRIDNNGTHYKTGIVSVSLYKGEMVDIKYVIYNFRTEDNFKIKSVNYDLDSDSDFEISLIKLNSAMYNGQLDVDTFNDSLQHEISHFYDFFRKDCQPPLYKDKDVDFYQKCLQCTYNDDIEIQTIGYALYLSFDSEQIGYANGLDAFLRENGGIDKSGINGRKRNRNLLYRSEAHKALKMMYDSLELFDKYSSVIPDVFNISSEKCKRIVSKGIQSYTRRIARVVYKNTFR